MGKHVLAVVALGLLWVSSNVPMAQEKPKGGAGTEYPFEAGRYLTAEDHEHLVAALNYVDLKPADLSYEKKVALNQRFVLPVCAQCLDNPLSVPKVAEDAAQQFHFASHSSARAKYAAELQSHGGGRWVIDELKKDEEVLAAQLEDINKSYEKLPSLPNDKAEAAKVKASKEYQDADNAITELHAQFREVRATLICGGPLVELASTGVEFKRSRGGTYGDDLIETLFPSMCALLRNSPAVDKNALQLLGAQLPAAFAESDVALPGASQAKPDADPFDPASKASNSGVLVGGSRVSALMELIAAEWRSRVRSKVKTIENAAESKVPGVSGTIVGVWQTPRGKIVIGGTGDNTYEGDDFIAIIDLGGNDIYRGRVASGIGLPGHAPLSFVLDLGGDDRYMGEDFTQGFGFNGVGILWDLGGGRDYYKSRFCSQACGLLGYGELFDDGGDDEYFTDSGSQGAACFGYGHLIDAGGNDTYRGARYVQACALVGGVAVLTDGGGNDLYYAGGKYLHVPLHNDHYQSLSQGFAIGNRNDANPSMGTGGGVALLLDQGNGNDNYIADIYGQGSSYWLSLGMQVDEGGNDNHILYQYGLGGGIHLSTGILVDLAGNDSYTDPWGVGLGGAHDYAVGWLIDRAGNDLYQGGGQGQGLNFSFGCLLDCAGNDAHSCPGAGSIGAGHNNDVSLLLDLDGEDFYTVPDVKNGRFTRQGNHGLIYDCPSGGWFPGIDASTLPTKQDPAPKKVKVQHILISFDGCKVPLRNAEQRSEAEAEALARTLLKQSRTKGADWKELMDDWSEDVGGGEGYLIDENSRKNYVKEFGDTGLSLGIGQIALSAKGPYGWHIIKRVE